MFQDLVRSCCGTDFLPQPQRVARIRRAGACVDSTQDKIATLTAFFNYVDEDHDGFITPAEIEDAMAVSFPDPVTGVSNGIITEADKEQAGQEWLSVYFGQQDTNHDGKISLQELLAWNGIVQ